MSRLSRSSESVVNREGSSLLRDATSSPPRRKKRAKYTLKACDQCKKRKVKCDGGQPCRRCADNTAQCSYSDMPASAGRGDSALYGRMGEKIAVMEEQIKMLTNGSISNHTDPVDLNERPTRTPISFQRSSSNLPSVHAQQDRSVPQHSASYEGRRTVSHAHTLATVRMPTTDTASEPRLNTFEAKATDSVVPPDKSLPQSLFLMSLTEISRLINLYEDETGSIYPFLDIVQVRSCANRFHHNVSRNRGASRECMSDNETNEGWDNDLDILKIVVAIALAIEGCGFSEMGKKLVGEVEHSIDQGIAATKADIRGLKVLTLVSIYQFHSDEEVLAWRTIGMAVRIALEIGLHRREKILRFRNPSQRSWVTKLFWCIYVLDRRWSFGVGMPFALHDLEIDPGLPEPNSGDNYLLSMIAYGRIGSKVWKAMSGFSSSMPPLNTDETSYLDFQILQWRESIPPKMKIHNVELEDFMDHSRPSNRLRVLFVLRANQMRILIHRRTLLTSATVRANLQGAQIAIDAAKESIRLLERLNKFTDIYRAQQACFNYFIVSSLAVIFLANCHARPLFDIACKEEISMALDMIKGFSATSYVARKLWKTILQWKETGPKLGILSKAGDDDLPNDSSTAKDNQVTNLVTQRDAPTDKHNNISSTVLPAEPNASNGTIPVVPCIFPMDYDFESPYGYPQDGNQLSNELVNLFEAIEPRDVPASSEIQLHDPMFDMYTFGTEEDLSRTLIDLF